MSETYSAKKTTTTTKIHLCPEMRVARKIFTRATANVFFFWRYSLFLFSFFCFFVFLLCFCFFGLFVCFLKLKMIHIRICRRGSDKKAFTRSISGNKTPFLGLVLNLFNSVTFYLFLLSTVEKLIEYIIRNMNSFLETISVCS